MSNKRGPGTHHVVPNPQGGWDVRRGGADRAAGHFDHKTDAVDRGREISRNAGTELKIHNRDGRIGQSDLAVPAVFAGRWQGSRPPE